MANTPAPSTDPEQEPIFPPSFLLGLAAIGLLAGIEPLLRGTDQA
ncbi:MAG TPA: hypothetical protein VER79_10295 [Candidatus Limnocylindrales bacterium]|nr:hypothetical protein [Candidatus Limnocylindrales bacterium]